MTAYDCSLKLKRRRRKEKKKKKKDHSIFFPHFRADRKATIKCAGLAWRFGPSNANKRGKRIRLLIRFPRAPVFGSSAEEFHCSRMCGKGKNRQNETSELTSELNRSLTIVILKLGHLEQESVQIGKSLKIEKEKKGIYWVLHKCRSDPWNIWG